MLEVILEAFAQMMGEADDKSFNPCCAGSNSGRDEMLDIMIENYVVSILVVLEVILEEVFSLLLWWLPVGFNPCCAGSNSGSVDSYIVLGCS